MVALRGEEVRVSSEWWNISISIRFSGCVFSCKTELNPPGERREFILEDEFLVDAIPGIVQILKKLYSSEFMELDLFALSSLIWGWFYVYSSEVPTDLCCDQRCFVFMVEFLEALPFKAEVAGNSCFVIFQDPNISLSWALAD